MRSRIVVPAIVALFALTGCVGGDPVAVEPPVEEVVEAEEVVAPEPVEEEPEFNPCDAIVGNMWVLEASDGCIDPWPLTSESGLLFCDPFGEGVGAVVYAPDEEPDAFYAVNGMADAAGYDDIEPIWADRPDSDGLKVNIGALINAGLTLCDN